MNATEKLVNMLQVIIEIKRIQNFLVKLGLGRTPNNLFIVIFEKSLMEGHFF